MWRFRREWHRFRVRFPAREVLAKVAIAVPLIVVGVVGFVAGSPSSVDLDDVKAAAVAEGREAGTTEGDQKGFDHGYEEARNQSYDSTYDAAYRSAYVREFEQAGLTPPEEIPVPEAR
jgi:hypothetical protein